MQDQWTLLLKLQAQKLQQQEKQLREEEALRKFYYKKQLDEHIASTKGRGIREKMMDAEILKQKQQQEKIEEEMMLKRQQEKKMMRRQALKQNLAAIVEKHQQTMKQRKKESDLVSDILRLQTEMMVREKKSESQRKTRQKTELVNAYNQKIHEEKLKRQQLKSEESLYLQQYKRVEAQKERQREDYINKIKYGYRQNPEAYNSYLQLQHKKDAERQSAMSNYLSSYHIQDMYTPEKLQSRHSKRAGKEEQIRHLNKMQQQSIYTPEQKRKIKEVQKQLEIVDILDQQIQEKQLQRIKEKHMDNKQIRYNKDSFQGAMAIPGLSLNDYHRSRQREILNHSLGLQYRSISKAL